MNKKWGSIILLLMGVCTISYAQQRPQYSQYMLNQYLLNPAVAGTSDHYDIKAGYRAQWVGFNDNSDPSGKVTNVAPTTFYLSGHVHLGQHIGPNRGRHRNEPTSFHGLGALINNDKTGPTSRTSIYGSYAFNMKLAADVRLSVGAFVGMQQFRLDGSLLRAIDPLTTVGSGITKTVPDGSIGTWLYGKNYYFGASAHQIFQNKLFANDGISAQLGVNKLNSHYFITAGYAIKASEHLKFIPSVLIKYVSPAPISFDVNVKARYREIMWGGVSYRQDGSVVFLVGGLIKNMIEFGYSFDYTTSAISKFGPGSHEVMVGVRLNPKGSVRNPSDFW